MRTRSKEKRRNEREPVWLLAGMYDCDLNKVIFQGLDERGNTLKAQPNIQSKAFIYALKVERGFNGAALLVSGT
jgi:hypothetical protein